jgi:hypothetical protein
MEVNIFVLPLVSAWGSTVNLNVVILIYTLLISRWSTKQITEYQAKVNFLMFIKVKVLSFLCWLVNTSLFSVRIILMCITVICYRGFCKVGRFVGTDKQNAVRIHMSSMWSAVAVRLWHAASPRIACEMCVAISVKHRPLVTAWRIACPMRQLLRLRCKANNLTNRRFQHTATCSSQCEGSAYCGLGLFGRFHL